MKACLICSFSKGSPLMPGGLDRVTPSENIPGDVNTGKTTLEKLFLQAKKAAAPPTTTAAGPNGDDQIRCVTIHTSLSSLNELSCSLFPGVGLRKTFGASLPVCGRTR